MLILEKYERQKGLKKMSNRMKKISVLLSCLCMICLITGCGKSIESKEGESQTVTDGKSENTMQENTISFSGKDIEGNEVDTKELFANHKVTMINVWATYCQPCIKELPDLEQLNKDMEAEGLQIVGILSDVVDIEGNYSQENWELGKKIVEEKGVTYPTILCDVSSFQKQIAVDAVPTTFFVDEQGNLLGEVQIGSLSKDEYQKMAEDALEEVGE